MEPQQLHASELPLPVVQEPSAPAFSIKKDRVRIQSILSSMQESNKDEEAEQVNTLSQQIMRRMLQTNLSDRRALGGILGTAILGLVGLAVGLNVIGLIIGGILGALLGTYAGRRIKENTIRSKKLLNVNMYIIKFAAFVQHLLDFNADLVQVDEVRRLMALLLSESRMLIMLRPKLKRYERRQVGNISRRLTKCLKKDKYLFAIKEIYWVVKEWCSLRRKTESVDAQHLADATQTSIARTCYQFLRPLSKLLLLNSRSLNASQKSLEQKINSILMDVAVIELYESHPNQLLEQQEAEQEFMHLVYREVELKQLKEIMQDQIAKDILNEDQIRLQQQQQQHQNQIQYILDQPFAVAGVNAAAQGDAENQIDNSNAVQQKQQPAAAPATVAAVQTNEQQFVVWSNVNPSVSQSVSMQQRVNGTTNPVKQQSRLIDLIHMASMKKQEEEESSSNSSQKNQENYMSVAPANPIVSSQISVNIVNHSIVNKHAQVDTRSRFHKQQALKNRNANIDSEGYIQQKYLANNAEEEACGDTPANYNVVVTQQCEQYLPTQGNMGSFEHCLGAKKEESVFALKDKAPRKGQQVLCGSGSLQVDTVPDAANFMTQDEHQFQEMVRSQKEAAAAAALAQKVIVDKYQEGSKQFKLREQMQATIDELKFDSQVLNQNQMDMMKSRVAVALAEANGDGAQTPMVRKSFARSKHGQEFLKMNSSDSIMMGETKNNDQKEGQEEEEKKQNLQDKVVVIAVAENDAIAAEVEQVDDAELQSQKQSKQEQQSEEKQSVGQYAKDDHAHVEHVVINVVSLEQDVKVEGQKWDAEIAAKLDRLNELDKEDPEKTWEKVISKDRMKIYRKQIPKNPSVMIRAEAFVEGCTQEEIFEQIYYAKNRTKWDKVTLGFTVVDKIGEGQDVIYFYIDPGFGVTKRDFLQKRAVRRDFPERGDLTIIFFSIDHPAHPEKKGTIRAISHIAAYIIRRDEATKGQSSHLSIITQSDVKGSIPKYIVNCLSARAPAKWIESMRKGVLDHRKNKQ